MTVAANGDTGGNASTDPTRNVLDLVEAANLRQDDLREAAVAHMKELAAVHAQCARDDRESDLRVAELRATHDKELRISEAQRIDAIRAVDQGNVQRAAEVQATQALTLATQVVTSAEALRISQSEATALADTKLITALEPIQKRLDELTRTQYEQQGQKQQVVESRGSQTQNTNLIFALLGVMQAVIIIAISIYAATN